MYAKNETSVRNSHEGRIKYDKEVEKTLSSFYSDDQLINLWNSNSILYGRVDLVGNIVYPKESKMVDKDTVRVFDFVAQAYEDLINFIDKSDISRTLDVGNGNIFPLSLATGYTSPHILHAKYLEDNFNNFIQETYASPQEKQIKDYKIFQNKFSQYLKSTSDKLLLSKIEYFRTTSLPPTCSGLVIETNQSPYDIDSTKVSNYIKDPNFRYYIEAARRHGFFVDQNAPWRLVVDIRSCYIREKLKNFGINNLIEFFSNYYTKAHKDSMRSLFDFSKNMWDSYVEISPISSTLEFPSLVPTTMAHIRKKYTKFSQRDHTWWVRFYIETRFDEVLESHTPGEVDDLVTSIINTYGILRESSDYRKISRYIEKEVSKKFEISSGISLTNVENLYNILHEDCPEQITVEQEFDLVCSPSD